MTPKHKSIEEMVEEVSYSQFYELPYNPLNKMREVIGTQESGTKFVARAFDMQGFIRYIATTTQGKEEGIKALWCSCGDELQRNTKRDVRDTGKAYECLGCDVCIIVNH